MMAVRTKTFKRKWVILFFTASLLVLAAFFLPLLSGSIHNWLNPKPVGTVKVHKYKDLNRDHLLYAKKTGIRPFKTNKGLNDSLVALLSDRKLVLVKNGHNHIIEKLTHSKPYLVPEAADLLNEIGIRFNEKLKQHNKGRFYFKVSSLLRTKESQKMLSRSNRNASSNSAHFYGTTFDIAYSKVIKKPLPWISREVADATAIKLLSEAIGELRSEGRCLVVTETGERCFHITHTGATQKD